MDLPEEIIRFFRTHETIIREYREGLTTAFLIEFEPKEKENEMYDANSNMAMMATIKDASTTAKSSPQVTKMLDEQEKLLAILEETIGKLDDRLSPVLLTIGPEPIGDSEKPSYVPVADRIYRHNNQVYLMRQHVDSLISRLEV